MYVPDISIIVPVFNVEEYLGKCLRSLTAQTHGNIEIIVVNDGSTDRSIDIIRAFAAIDERIVVLDQHVNRGLGAARNVGIRKASGGYLMFVDSDDWVDSHTCAELLLAGRDKPDIVVYGLVHWSSGVAKRRVIYQTERLLPGHQYLLDSMRSGGFSPTVCNKMFKKRTFHGLTFPENSKHEDIFYTTVAMGMAETVCTTRKASYYYRKKREGSITAALNPRGVDDLFHIYEMLIDELRGNSQPILSEPFFFDMVERLTMEVLLKIIDGTKVEDVDMISRKLKGNGLFNEYGRRYIFEGRELRYRLVLLLFFLHQRLFFVMGRAYYAVMES